MLHNSLKPVKGKKEALKKVLSDLAEREGEDQRERRRSLRGDKRNGGGNDWYSSSVREETD